MVNKTDEAGPMKIAAYQFGISGRIQENMEKITAAVRQAAEKGVEMIIFPECALSSYPPRDLPDSKSLDASKVDDLLNLLQDLSDDLKI